MLISISLNNSTVLVLVKSTKVRANSNSNSKLELDDFEPSAEEVGPPSSVSASRDYISTTNQTPQFYDTINSLLLLSQHDRQEVKQTTQHGITL